MIVYDLEQRSPEWYAARLGVFTASEAAIIYAQGDTLKKLILEKTSEIITGIPAKENYVNADMQRGIDLESEAISAYELQTGYTVQPIGFIKKSKNSLIGCSPDGFINNYGDIEVKCPNNANYVNLLLTKKIKGEYIKQIQMRLLIHGRKWCDYVAYNPNFNDRPLFIKRVLPDEKIQKVIAQGLALAVKEVKENLKILREF